MGKQSGGNVVPKKQRPVRSEDETADDEEAAESARPKPGIRPKKRKKYSWDEASDSTQRGLLVIFLFALAAVSLLSFVGAAGQFGDWVDTFLGWIFGWGRYVMPVIFAVLGYLFLHPERYEIRILNYIGLALFLLSGLGLLHLFIPLPEFVDGAQAGRGGGFLGIILAWPLLRFTGVWVTIIVLVALFIGSWLIMFNTSLQALAEQLRRFGFVGGIARWVKSRVHARMNGYTIAGKAADDEADAEALDDEPEVAESESADGVPGFASKAVAGEAVAATPEDLEQMSFIPKQKPARRRRQIDLPLTLLKDRGDKPTSGDIESNKETIRRTLENFGIEVEMGDVSVGPMVSQYTLKPAEGVKLTQITTLHNDIALALAAHPIRIEAPIPGKALVGIEVPNKATATVALKEMLASKEFKKRKNNLTLAIGKDVAGKPYLASLQSMPHLLIAGATGSGKSVAINGVIVSLLYQNSPDDLKFILVDPKRVELTLYNGIPHLLTPVITDVEKTINALKWTVAEMDRRYELLAREGKREIGSYNEAVSDDERLPYIVFIIDELADLMSVAAQSVEAAIVRLAQMSRAVGIHLVLATQRPSVNVITGLIKANMPARMAFSVTSLVDSRTILDFSGAEKLLGRGDMLYIDAQVSKPKRLQGAFLEDKEIENVVAYLRNQGDPEYASDVTEPSTAGPVPGFSGGEGGDDNDDLLPQAKEVILSAGKASASLLQRRLRVGYARAARILDILEEQGFIGPADGAKPREILATEVEIGDAPDEVDDGDDDDGDELEDDAADGIDDGDDEETAPDDDDEAADETAAADGAKRERERDRDVEW